MIGDLPASSTGNPVPASAALNRPRFERPSTDIVHVSRTTCSAERPIFAAVQTINLSASILMTRMRVVLAADADPARAVARSVRASVTKLVATDYTGDRGPMRVDRLSAMSKPVDGDTARCQECRRLPAESWLDDDGPLCDRCYDHRIAAATGLPRLPDAPAPTEIQGPDGRRHVLRYRVWRAPTGISVELREDNTSSDVGFEYAVLGDHDAEVATLVAAVRAEAQRGIGRSYLQPGLGGVGWCLAGREVAGRMDFDPDGGPHRVVIDGRPLSWEELGEALGSFEGWRFRLIVEDPSVDLRTAEVPTRPTAAP